MERPLFWHQGLFLQPQHLQLADLYVQSLLTPVYKYLCPYPWGVGDLEIQTAALDNLTFNPLRGNLIFPDMTYVALPGNAIIEARSFDGAWAEGGKPFSVYIGLKKWNEFGENVTVVPRLSDFTEVNTRFVTTVDPEEIQDLHHNGPPAKVQRLYHVLKVFWGHTIRKICAALSYHQGLGNPVEANLGHQGPNRIPRPPAGILQA